jgi:hypothetical protein
MKDDKEISGWGIITVPMSIFPAVAVTWLVSSLFSGLPDLLLSVLVLTSGAVTVYYAGFRLAAYLKNGHQAKDI